MAGIVKGITGLTSRLIPRPPPDRAPDSNGAPPSDAAGRHQRGSRYLLPSEAQEPTPPGQAGVSGPWNHGSSDSDEPVTLAPTSFSNEVTLPKLVMNADPSIKLKLRKRYYPLGLTRLTLGADLDIHSKEVSLKWSWKDRFLGARLQFEGSQVSLSKRFDVDSRTHMYVRAAYDVHARRALFSFDVKPFRGLYANGTNRPGFAVKQSVPVDKHVSVEVLARMQLPEARFSTHNSVSLGEGDFVVDLEELNFKFMLQ